MEDLILKMSFMKDGFKFFNVLKTSMQRTLRRETCIVHLSDFKSKSDIRTCSQKTLSDNGSSKTILVSGGAKTICLPAKEHQTKHENGDNRGRPRGDTCKGYAG